ncbi:MAG: conjugal transfer protein TraN [Pseudomonadota bacterium]
MIEKLTCLEGICCAFAFLVGLTVWFNAFPKWPAIAGMAKALMGGALFAFILVVPIQAQAQMTRDDAEQEAKDLAAGLETQVQDGANQTVDATTVPSFVTDRPSETSYYGNSHNLDTAGHAAISGNEAASLVDSSITSRPIVTQAELDTWTSNGLAIEANAQSIVVEYTGAYGDCTTSVSSGTTDTTFTYSCDEGETLIEYPASCHVPLNISFSTNYVYQFSNNWSDDACFWEPGLEEFIIRGHGGCTITQTNSANCGQSATICGADCDDQNFEAVCTSPVPNLAHVRTQPGPISESWDTSGCDVRETDPTCTFLGEVCIEPAETRIINGQPVTRDCWRTQRNYQCASLGGSSNDCSPPAGCTLASSECLSYDDATGACRTTEHTYSCTVAGTPGGAVGYCDQDVYCIAGDCNTIVREQNDEFHQAVSALSMLGQLQNDVNDATLEIFPGEHLQCSKAVAGLKNCCSDDGVLLSLGFSCSPQEESLALRKGEGQCHYVGTYCSKKTFFGICLTKRRSYCCFNNKLARIIHEQGRPQISFDWGDRKNPDCSGFTVVQFQALDLSTVDFSEFYDEVLATFSGPDTNAATAAITTRIINAYQCPPNC